MAGLVIVLFPFLALALPVLFLIVANYRFRNGMPARELVLKGFLAAFVYLITTVFVLFLLAFVTVGPDPHRNGPPVSFSVIIFCLFVVLIYGVLGWSYCSHFAGRRITLAFFFENQEETTNDLKILDE